jgi:hypothetical protein
MTGRDDAGASRAPKSGVYAALLGVAAAALALRLPGLFGDLWLDEIWTLDIARELRSPLGLFTEVRDSNNHHLNTFLYYLLDPLLGDRGSWSGFRVPSLLAGVGSVILAWSIASRIGRLEAVFACLLTTTSYLLIHFSSEGRGYALVVFFALASTLAVQRFAERKRWRSAAVFWLLACLGFLSHLLYLHVFVALALWLPLHLARRGERGPAIPLRLLQCFAPPAAFLAWFYVFDISRMKIGGGPAYQLFDVLVKATSYAGGGPATGPVALAAAGLTAGISLAAIAWLWRSGRSEWLFFLVVMYVSPALVIALARPDVMFVRYFLLSVAFGLIAVSCLLAEMWRRGGVIRLAACALVLLSLVGNGINVAGFYRHGRGAYLETLLYILDRTPNRRPVVASDHDFRNRTVILYYNRFLPPSRQIVYVKRARSPEWLLLHRIGELGEVMPIVGDQRGTRYRLQKVFPYSDLSGWHWILYRKQRM